MQTKNKSAEMIQQLETRNNFFSIASQELRNPLAGLMLQSEMIARRLDSEKEEMSIEKMRKAVGHLHSDIHRLSKLVEEMTDLSEICNKNFCMRFEHFHLGSFMKEIAAELRTNFPDFDQLLSWEVRGDLIVFWDRSRIEQVITNIISHSFNYGEATPIKVKVDHDGEKVSIMISDLGSSPVVEEFKKQHGFGMGLFIGEEILRSHAGQLTLQSTPGHGSHFTISLPADR